jgi:hypothetical protein
MKKNMGSYDKLIRLVVAIVLIILYYRGMFSSAFGIVVLVVAFILTLTSLMSFCPLYTLFGLNTCKKK